MDDQSLQPYLSQLRFSQANKLRLFQNSPTAQEPREPSYQNILSIDEIRQCGLQYKHLFLESMKRKRNDPSIFLIIGGGNGKYQPYSITREAFIELLRTCRLPRAFFQSANCNNGALGHYVNYSGAA